MTDAAAADTEPRMRTFVFIRADCFYSIELPENDDLNAHAEANPGTKRIEDVYGNVLWRVQ